MVQEDAPLKLGARATPQLDAPKPGQQTCDGPQQLENGHAQDVVPACILSFWVSFLVVMRCGLLC